MNLLKEQQEFINEKNDARELMEKKKTFLKIFMGIAGSMFLVIFLAFSLIYGNIKDIIIDQNIKMSMQAFEQVQSEIENANETANLIATQVMLDDICSGFLNAMTNRHLNSIELNRIRGQLSMFENTNSAVKSIYMYNSALDMFLTSGYRFKAVGKDEFTDRNLIEILETPDAYENRSLIKREIVTRYPNQTEMQETVYSYFLESPLGEQGNVVVINMELDNLFHKILETEAMKDSRMLIVDDDNEHLMDFQTLAIEGTPKFAEDVTSMLASGKLYMEYKLGGVKYFVSAMNSGNNSWSYVKVTKWDTMFASLLRVKRGMLFFFCATAVIVLLIALGNSVSIVSIHGKLMKKYAQTGAYKMKKSEINALKDSFLIDFLHGRKLFGKNRLTQEMGKVGIDIQEEQKFTLVILQICAYDKFLELFGKREAYDIKYGFQNIFAETFEKEFKNLSLINRDDTITFVLETGEENPEIKIEKCFREFLENVKVFVKWEFMLYGTKRTMPFERLPELNASLKQVTGEGFFYPENTFLTYEKIQAEHNEETALQCLDGDCLAKVLKLDKNVKEVYTDFVGQIKNCRMAEYMNIMLWLGITMSRDRKLFVLSGQEGNEFLAQLSRCEKASETNELFMEIFDKILQKKESGASKKGVSGRLSEVKRYIEENFKDANLTMEQLGEEFSVSPNYLGQLFKKEMGVSIADYISNARLEGVLKELAETNRSAKEIAEDYGFANSNYFYTHFRKKVGLTPQAYREQFRTETADDTDFQREK